MTKLEFIFPFLAAIIFNNKLNEKLKNFDQKKIQQNWIDDLTKSGLNDSMIENIVHKIYSAEDNRRYNLESKGTSLLAGIGISISVLSIMLGFLAEVEHISLLQLISVGFFLIAITNLILAAFGAAKAIKVTMKYTPYVTDLRNSLEKSNSIINWVIEHLISMEYNAIQTSKKSNWVDTAQQHFARGLGLIVMGFVVLFLDIVCRWIFIEF